MPGLDLHSEGANSLWFNCLYQRPDAKCRLICFPWCGGGSQFYARWGKEFSKDIEVVGVRLPGRETRSNEKYMLELDRCVKLLSEEIVRLYSDKPFAFFGHSMGAWLCFATANHIREHYNMEPTHVYFSASHAPHSKELKAKCEDPEFKPLHELPDEDLIARIAKDGSTPKPFLEDQDFMCNTFLPLYRADLKLIGSLRCELNGKKPLSCPVTVLEGNKDIDVQVSEFSELTSGNFQHMKLQGGHFYILKEENSKRLRERIQKALVLI